MHIALVMRRRMIVPLVQSISGTATRVLDAVAITIPRIDAIAHVSTSTTPGRVRRIPVILALILVLMLMQIIGRPHSLVKIDIREVVDRGCCADSTTIEEN